MSEAVALRVAADYANTHARLSGDPEYRRLKAAADAEQASTSFIARNMFAIYIEMHTPFSALKEES